MQLIHVDEAIAVCVKPVGISAEAGGLPDRLAETLGGQIYPVHRLDQAVGGVMVYARQAKAAAALSRAMQAGQLTKQYAAAVHGHPRPPEGRWEDLLWKDSRKNKVYVVSRPRKGVKPAALAYRVLAEDGDSSLVWVQLFTGRSHQIRVQFASRGHPLLGDHKYGSRDKRASPALWSCHLSFPHPVSGKRMCFFYPPEGENWERFPPEDRLPGSGYPFT